MKRRRVRRWGPWYSIKSRGVAVCDILFTVARYAYRRGMRWMRDLWDGAINVRSIYRRRRPVTRGRA